MMDFRKLGLCAVAIAMCATVDADRPAQNRPLVRAAEHGGTYAKSVPHEAAGNSGTTMILRVGTEHDMQLCQYDWYARELHIGGSRADPIIVRFEHSDRGRKPGAEQLAIGIYRYGETIAEYSTLKMIELGSGVRFSVSNHAVFARPIGFRKLEPNSHVFEVPGISGKVFRFDLQTGAVASRETDQP